MNSFVEAAQTRTGENLERTSSHGEACVSLTALLTGEVRQPPKFRRSPHQAQQNRRRAMARDTGVSEEADDSRFQHCCHL